MISTARTTSHQGAVPTAIRAGIRDGVSGGMNDRTRIAGECGLPVEHGREQVAREERECSSGTVAI